MPNNLLDEDKRIITAPKEGNREITDLEGKRVFAVAREAVSEY
jgi:hypothetical protein